MPAVAITIPQPCHQSWASMAPTATGRHCAACQQTVVDFTLKTDAEILAFVARAAGARTCGRFAAGQLERPLQRAASAVPTRWRAWLAAAFAVWGLRETSSGAARAQAPTEQRAQRRPGTPPEQLRASVRPDREGADTGVVLRGVVTDSLTGEGLPGVTILVQGTSIGTSSGVDGLFTLPVPAAQVGPAGVLIAVSSVGYTSQHLVLAASQAGASQHFRLQQSLLGAMGIVVVGGFEPRAIPPAPWHPRRFYYWAKYWVARPFRRW